MRRGKARPPRRRAGPQVYDLRRDEVMRHRATPSTGSSGRGPYEDVQAVLKPEHPHNAAYRQVASYWEMVYSFARHGIVHPEFWLENNGEGMFLYARRRPTWSASVQDWQPAAFRNAEWAGRPRSPAVARSRPSPPASRRSWSHAKPRPCASPPSWSWAAPRSARPPRAGSCAPPRRAPGHGPHRCRGPRSRLPAAAASTTGACASWPPTGRTGSTGTWASWGRTTISFPTTGRPTSCPTGSSGQVRRAGGTRHEAARSPVTQSPSNGRHAEGDRALSYATWICPADLHRARPVPSHARSQGLEPRRATSKSPAGRPIPCRAHRLPVPPPRLGRGHRARARDPGRSRPDARERSARESPLLRGHLEPLPRARHRPHVATGDFIPRLLG